MPQTAHNFCTKPNIRELRKRERESRERGNIPVPNPVVLSALHFPADCSHGQCSKPCYDESPAEAFYDRLDYVMKPYFDDLPSEFIKRLSRVTKVEHNNTSDSPCYIAKGPQNWARESGWMAQPVQIRFL